MHNPGADPGPAAAGEPTLLNVSGPGGSGKSALVRAFRRVALAAGVPVVVVDGREARPTPEGLNVVLAAALVRQAQGGGQHNV